jgi:Protein of unknown function (DUF1826)
MSQTESAPYQRGQTPRRVVVSDGAGSLAAAISDPGVDMWLWQRDLSQVVLASAGRLVRQPLSLRTVVPCNEPRSELTTALEAAGIPARELHLWAHELGSLVELICGLGHRRALVRLQSSEKVRAAPLFHVDGTHLRLLCTYRGPGTEWLPEHAVNRAELGRRYRSHKIANARIARSPRSAQRVLPGWVAVIRGAGSAAACRRGLVHRSPETAAPRLLLRIDPGDR